MRVAAKRIAMKGVSAAAAAASGLSIRLSGCLRDPGTPPGEMVVSRALSVRLTAPRPLRAGRGSDVPAAPATPPPRPSRAMWPPAPLLLAALLLLLLLFLRRRRLPPRLPAEGKAVLITGCDKGFGHALASHLHAKGFTVFAGCLLLDQGGDGARELCRLGSGRMHVLQLDVCCEDQVARALRYVEARLEDPARGLWGLVNNAGIASFGEVEFTSVEKYQRVADINLWGTIRVTKAFLPLIRRARGRIVNMSSMLGRMVRPMRSSYCVSKFGLEAFSDCLRQEMYRWGVSVVAIEPSNYIAATGILTPEGIEAEAERMWRGASEAIRADYGEADFQEKLSRMKGFAHSGLRDISPVLDALTEALAARHPYSRYTPMEASWWLRLQAATHLPTALVDWLFVS